ncbi:hypothetical protein [Shewanella surugensis]|uniref:Uncharacterized protein n=1 Tax=Shewanella surugensis TaxID=212020 RepID=A0ABT0L7U3_9GAMM|nr:hypothetical protein [Shewanella surugensis]MCL1123758.1 hypothetical protein [Shewanella surugensis]
MKKLIISIPFIIGSVLLFSSSLLAQPLKSSYMNIDLEFSAPTNMEIVNFTPGPYPYWPGGDRNVNPRSATNFSYHCPQDNDSNILKCSISFIRGTYMNHEPLAWYNHYYQSQIQDGLTCQNTSDERGVDPNSRTSKFAFIGMLDLAYKHDNGTVSKFSTPLVIQHLGSFYRVGFGLSLPQVADNARCIKVNHSELAMIVRIRNEDNETLSAQFVTQRNQNINDQKMLVNINTASIMEKPPQVQIANKTGVFNVLTATNDPEFQINAYINTTSPLHDLPVLKNNQYFISTQYTLERDLCEIRLSKFGVPQIAAQNPDNFGNGYCTISKTGPNQIDTFLGIAPTTSPTIQLANHTNESVILQSLLETYPQSYSNTKRMHIEERQYTLTTADGSPMCQISKSTYNVLTVIEQYQPDLYHCHLTGTGNSNWIIGSENNPYQLVIDPLE